MLITDLQNRLRTMLRERIEAGELTGTDVAKRAGFRQAHVSNFLNQRRGLSVEAMDRVMETLRLEVPDLLPEGHKRITVAEGSCCADFDSVPMVGYEALSQSDFGSGEIVELLRFKKSFLQRLRAEMANQRSNWRRFVSIKADKDCYLAMRPRLLLGSALLIDRHYNSLRSYRRQEQNLYVVKSAEGCKVRYVELQGTHLTLRPESRNCALGYVQLGKGETFAEYVIGRVAHISVET